MVSSSEIVVEHITIIRDHILQESGQTQSRPVQIRRVRLLSPDVVIDTKGLSLLKLKMHAILSCIGLRNTERRHALVKRVLAKP